MEEHLDDDVMLDGGELVALREQLAATELDNRRLMDRVIVLEQRATNLAKLFAASSRLQSKIDRATALAAIEEIVVNFIGSEKYCICELDEATGRYEIISAFGLDERWVGFQDGPEIRAVIDARKAYVAGPGDPPEPLVCLPLEHRGTVTHVIIIYALMPQKQALDALDDELFAMLRIQGAHALACARLLEHVPDEARADAGMGAGGDGAAPA